MLQIWQLKAVCKFQNLCSIIDTKTGLQQTFARVLKAGNIVTISQEAEFAYLLQHDKTSTERARVNEVHEHICHWWRYTP